MPLQERRRQTKPTAYRGGIGHHGPIDLPAVTGPRALTTHRAPTGPRALTTHRVQTVHRVQTAHRNPTARGATQTPRARRESTRARHSQRLPNAKVSVTVNVNPTAVPNSLPRRPCLPTPRHRLSRSRRSRSPTTKPVATALRCCAPLKAPP